MADNKAFQKKANISLVMQTVRIKNQISRIDISRELGLDRSTITNIVSVLMERDLLIEMAEGASVSKGGRKPVLLGINPRFGLILGLEIQVNLYRATLMGLNGSTIWNKSGDISKSDELYETIQTIYSELEEDIKKEDIPLVGIGIGLPGHVDPIKGEILSLSPFFNSSNSCKEKLLKYFDIPVVFDNDANCCAWGVLEQRKENSLKNFLYSIIELHGNDTLSADSEIGFGIVVNGSVYYGSNFAAGEIGDNLIDKNPDITANYEEYFRALFNKLSLFVSFLNPSHLFLGGEFIKHEKLVVDIAKESSIINKCELVFSSHREHEVSFGAARMFIERLFKVPGVGNLVDAELTWSKIIDLRSMVGGHE